MANTNSSIWYVKPRQQTKRASVSTATFLEKTLNCKHNVGFYANENNLKFIKSREWILRKVVDGRMLFSFRRILQFPRARNDGPYTRRLGKWRTSRFWSDRRRWSSVSWQAYRNRFAAAAMCDRLKHGRRRNDRWWVGVRCTSDAFAKFARSSRGLHIK